MFRVYAMPSYGRATAIEAHRAHMAKMKAHGIEFDALLVVSSGPGYPYGHGHFEGGIGYKRFYHWHSADRLNPGEARNVLTTLFDEMAKRSGDDSVLVQTDDDCLLSPIDMGIILKRFPLEAATTGIAMPLLKSGFVCQAARRHFMETDDTRMSIHAPFRVVVMGREVIANIGHYDPFLRFTQDLDYAIRARAAGFDLACYDTPLGETALPEAKYGGHELYRQTSLDDEVQQERAQHMLRYKQYLVSKYPGSFLDARGNFLWQKALRRASLEVRALWARKVPSIVAAADVDLFLA